MKIGKLIQQPGGYTAFIPEKFPPDEKIINLQQMLIISKYLQS